MLQFMGSQRVGHNLVTEQQWTATFRYIRRGETTSDVFIIFLQNWKKELEKHREKLLSGSESSSKKRQVIPFLFYCYSYSQSWVYIVMLCTAINRSTGKHYLI